MDFDTSFINGEHHIILIHPYYDQWIGWDETCTIACTGKEVWLGSNGEDLEVEVSLEEIEANEDMCPICLGYAINQVRLSKENNIYAS